MPRESFRRLPVVLHRARVAKWCGAEACFVERWMSEARRARKPPTLEDFLRLAESHHEMLLRLGGLLSLEDALDEGQDD